MTYTRKANLFAAIAFALAVAPHATVDAFVSPSPKAAIAQRITLQESTSPEEPAAPEGIQSYLQQNYPLFDTLLLSKIPSIYSSLDSSTDGYTIFCPSNSIMENIDSKRKVQISDPRNDEVTDKLASYHVIANGKVTQERLKREDWTVPRVDGVAALNIGGVVTMGGELRVGRSKSGGFMGWGAKEDGGLVIGNNEARIVKSTSVGNGIVHEVDGFVAPDLIWRYFDQLRIPGF
mmetsp:Transcript_3959/g.7077  ORF Transcript_3959/g.7077 Transcript_3959/m.7077 type:complete len:234 (+) Transcript_3959:123-824(+)|eukprot:CAMPEP_0201869900 /NCGR_PEP_ID=MMETSP0902-20130614/3238_1 /ASSEMBLY_ACC=CAM_ASM_000551 /TAXON_ID=420261 /ORGANISM="Thalassiosira antarctica, Strain CCMP982" /LENGTH=233 /DNA_ID=CAMNT_0048395463 /DNA_START=115 /DNA_END=816 /DNA_ORIENTATION=+